MHSSVGQKDDPLHWDTDENISAATSGDKGGGGRQYSGGQLEDRWRPSRHLCFSNQKKYIYRESRD